MGVNDGKIRKKKKVLKMIIMIKTIIMILQTMCSGFKVIYKITFVIDEKMYTMSM